MSETWEQHRRRRPRSRRSSRERREPSREIAAALRALREQTEQHAKELAEIRAIAAEYVKKTDPLIACSATFAIEDQNYCGNCRACLLEKVERPQREMTQRDKQWVAAFCQPPNETGMKPDGIDDVPMIIGQNRDQAAWVATGFGYGAACFHDDGCKSPQEHVEHRERIAKEQGAKEERERIARWLEERAAEVRRSNDGSRPLWAVHHDDGQASALDKAAAEIRSGAGGKA